MNRIVTIVFAAVMSVAAFSAPALAATTHHSRIYHAGSCRASGDFAVCDASGTAHHPAVIRVHVSATPRQRVQVSWDMTCAKGSGAGGRSGQFTARTPVDHVMRHPYTDPAFCTVAAGAQLSGSGSLHVWITYTRV
jgi:hypothetical protein